MIHRCNRPTENRQAPSERGLPPLVSGFICRRGYSDGVHRDVKDGEIGRRAVEFGQRLVQNTQALRPPSRSSYLTV